MKIGFLSFNIYLLTLLLLIPAACQSDPTKAKTKEQKALEKKQKKELSTLRFHMETNSDGTDKSHAVPVYRATPVLINVQRTAFLDEGSIAKALLVDTLGGFMIQLQFDRHGTFVLETMTAANKGRRMAIYSQFSDARWLAAPMIGQPNATGMLSFTPDCTRDEAERIVRGLNHVAEQLKKSSAFKNAN